MATNEGIFITSLDVEGFKRIKAVRVEPTPEGITIIGGKNRQGKTSVLDAMIWGLGGDKYRPTDAQNTDSDKPPEIEIKLSNGLIVERKGKNGSLTVRSEDGLTGGQTLLNRFIEQLALDLPKFMGSTAKEKANILLQIIGAGERLAELDDKEKMIFDNRRDAGRDSDEAGAALKSMVSHPGVEGELIVLSDLLEDIEAAESERRELEGKRNDIANLDDDMASHQDYLITLQASIDTAEAALQDCDNRKKTLRKEIEATTLTDVEKLREQLSNAEEKNQQLRDNKAFQAAQQDVLDKSTVHAKLLLDLKSVRATRSELLKNADMPLDGLSVADGELIYNGAHWDGMSKAEQMMVATSIVRKINPKCGFVLLDNLESMDTETLKQFCLWATDQGLQIIATRVSTGDECSIIIEDGQAVTEGTGEANNRIITDANFVGASLEENPTDSNCLIDGEAVQND